MSILLGELLRGSCKIDRFVLVDNRWPMLNAQRNSHNLNPMHLQENIWPFEMTYRKYNLKSSSGHRQLQRHIIANAPGPVILLGVHLCSILSLHAAQIYNDLPRCTFFCPQAMLPAADSSRKAEICLDCWRSFNQGGGCLCRGQI